MDLADMVEIKEEGLEDKELKYQDIKEEDDLKQVKEEDMTL